ncbi:hypothetical protein Tco_0154987 [Tanacetum coccineum]
METEALNNQAKMVNYDNENEYEIEDLGYESEEYTEDAHEDDENNHSNGYAKRGITRLCKFRREYGKPGGVKLSVTFDALNRISGKHKALFLSFLGDMVREHIGLHILSWKKVKSAKAKMARSKCVFPHTMGRGGYAHVERENEIEQDEEPTRGTLWLKGRVNKDGEYQDDEIRSVGDKLKETEDKIKEGTLHVRIKALMHEHYVLVRKREVMQRRGSELDIQEVIFDLPRSNKPADERYCVSGNSSINSNSADEERLEQLSWMKLLNLWELRERLDQSERILQVKIHNPKKMCRYYPE